MGTKLFSIKIYKSGISMDICGLASKNLLIIGIGKMKTYGDSN